MQERVINMDITNFMTWFISQIVKMFSWFFGILDNFKFAGTSLLSVIIVIMIFSALLPVLLTISKSVNFIGSRSERVERSNKKNEKS